MNDEYQTQQYWNNNMKKTELKEIIREEVRKVIDESQEFHDYLNRTSEKPAQGLNKFRPKGMEILSSFPFNKLPLTRKDVDWNNRDVDNWGRVYLPSLTDGDATETIFDQDQVKVFVNKFKKEYNEEPIFSIDSAQSKIRITNPKFTEWKESYIKRKGEYLKNM
jgi:hypothetical protein